MSWERSFLAGLGTKTIARKYSPEFLFVAMMLFWLALMASAEDQEILLSSFWSLARTLLAVVSVPWAGFYQEQGESSAQINSAPAILALVPIAPSLDCGPSSKQKNLK